MLRVHVLQGLPAPVDHQVIGQRPHRALGQPPVRQQSHPLSHGCGDLHPAQVLDLPGLVQPLQIHGAGQLGGPLPHEAHLPHLTQGGQLSRPGCVRPQQHQVRAGQGPAALPGALEAVDGPASIAVAQARPGLPHQLPRITGRAPGLAPSLAFPSSCHRPVALRSWRSFPAPVTGRGHHSITAEQKIVRTAGDAVQRTISTGASL